MNKAQKFYDKLDLSKGGAYSRSRYLTAKGFALNLVLVFLSFIALIFCIVFTIAHFDANFSERQCTRFEQQTGYNTKFAQFSHWTYECYVEFDGNFIPMDQFRAIYTQEVS